MNKKILHESNYNLREKTCKNLSFIFKSTQFTRIIIEYTQKCKHKETIQHKEINQVYIKYERMWYVSLTSLLMKFQDYLLNGR